MSDVLCAEAESTLEGEMAHAEDADSNARPGIRLMAVEIRRLRALLIISEAAMWKERGLREKLQVKVTGDSSAEPFLDEKVRQLWSPASEPSKTIDAPTFSTPFPADEESDPVDVMRAPIDKTVVRARLGEMGQLVGKSVDTKPETATHVRVDSCDVCPMAQRADDSCKHPFAPTRLRLARPGGLRPAECPLDLRTAVVTFLPGMRLTEMQEPLPQVEREELS